MRPVSISICSLWRYSHRYSNCWHKVVDCEQGRNESGVNYAQVFKLYGGYRNNSTSDVHGGHSLYFDDLKADLREVLLIAEYKTHRI